MTAIPAFPPVDAAELRHAAALLAQAKPGLDAAGSRIAGVYSGARWSGAGASSFATAATKMSEPVTALSTQIETVGSALTTAAGQLEQARQAYDTARQTYVQTIHAQATDSAAVAAAAHINNPQPPATPLPQAALAADQASAASALAGMHAAIDQVHQTQRQLDATVSAAGHAVRAIPSVGVGTLAPSLRHAVNGAHQRFVDLAGGGQLGGWIAAAIGVAGAPVTWASPLHTLVMRESNGDPNNVNTTDSNAAAGTPSIGLAQVIQPTFNQYAVRGHDNIRNPVDNVAAAIRYIKAKYGNISNVQQANPNLPPKGY